MRKFLSINIMPPVYLSLMIFVLMGIISPASRVNAEIAGAGWITQSKLPDIPADKEEIKARRLLTISSAPSNPASSTPLALETTASLWINDQASSSSLEVQALALGLQKTPKLIIEYVLNNIDYVPYYGSHKSPTQTMMDGCGNDIDQASLLIALLREAAFPSCFYMVGALKMTITDLANWLGVDQDKAVIEKVLRSGGIPYYWVSDTNIDGLVKSWDQLDST